MTFDRLASLKRARPAGRRTWRVACRAADLPVGHPVGRKVAQNRRQDGKKDGWLSCKPVSRLSCHTASRTESKQADGVASGDAMPRRSVGRRSGISGRAALLVVYRIGMRVCDSGERARLDWRPRIVETRAMAFEVPLPRATPRFPSTARGRGRKGRGSSPAGGQGGPITYAA